MTDSGAVYIFSYKLSNENENENDEWTFTFIMKITQAFVSPYESANDGFFGAYGISWSKKGQNLLAIGAQKDNANSVGSTSGSVYIFEYTLNGNLEYEFSFVTKLSQAYVTMSEGEDDDFFGVSVCFSPNHNLLAIGAMGDDDNAKSNSGSVYLFTYITANYHFTFVKKITVDSSDAAADDNFGISLSFSSNNDNLLAVGSSNDDDNGVTNSGSVYIYQFDVTSYEFTLVEKLTQNMVTHHTYQGGAVTGDQFGSSVSFANANDKYLLAVGSPTNDDDGVSNSGTVYIYEYDSATGPFNFFLVDTITQSWEGDHNDHVGAIDSNERIQENEYFGSSVSWSTRDNFLAIGASGDLNTDTDKNIGAVFLFENAWGPTPVPTPGKLLLLFVYIIICLFYFFVVLIDI